MRFDLFKLHKPCKVKVILTRCMKFPYFFMLIFERVSEK